MVLPDVLSLNKSCKLMYFLLSASKNSRMLSPLAFCMRNILQSLLPGAVPSFLPFKPPLLPCPLVKRPPTTTRWIMLGG